MATTYLPSTQEASITSLYEDVELQIIKQIADKLKVGLDAPDWQMRKALELELVKQKIQGQMNVTTMQAVKGVAALLKESYSNGADDAAKVLDTYLERMAPKGPLQPSKELYTLLKEQASGLAGVQHTILRSVDDVYRKVITEVGAPGMLLGAQTRQQAVQSALNKFADKGITGFVDKAGRNWEMSAYVTMATGTAAHRASTQGHLDQLTASGHDLVVVSDHKGECPQCRKWEGKVLSISDRPRGESEILQIQTLKEKLAKINPDSPWGKKYRAEIDRLRKVQQSGSNVAGTVAQARAEGLEHPGCRHRYSAWFEGISTAPEPQGKPEDYDLRAQQRGMERQVRAWKRRAAAGDPKAAAKVKQWQDALRGHVETNGLKRRADRERLISGRVGTFLEKRLPKVVGRELPMGPARAVHVPEMELKAEVTKVNKLMESVHWMPDDFKYRRIDSHNANDASYNFVNKSIDIGDRLDYPLNTIAHEHGHMFDAGYLGAKKNSTSALGFSKTNAAIKVEQEWAAWEEAVKETDLYKKMVARGDASDKYRTKLNELWARSYAQWLAKKTGDPDMLAELRRMQMDDGLTSISGLDWRDQVWSDADFEKVWKAVDDVMTLIGPKKRKTTR